jgi:polar amino acid transport system substrate-binding protein
MRVHSGRLIAVVATMFIALGLVLPAPAAADQCAPPGVDSASALPTNLAGAAKGPEEDKYTTPNVEPLNAVRSTPWALARAAP